MEKTYYVVTKVIVHTQYEAWNEERRKIVDAESRKDAMEYGITDAEFQGFEVMGACAYTPKEYYMKKIDECKLMMKFQPDLFWKMLEQHTRTFCEAADCLTEEREGKPCIEMVKKFDNADMDETVECIEDAYCKLLRESCMKIFNGKTWEEKGFPPIPEE